MCTQEYLILPLQHNTGVRQNLYVAGPSVRSLILLLLCVHALITVCAYRLLDFFMPSKLLPVLKARTTAKKKILAANAQPILSVDGAAINVSTLKKPNHHARS